MRASYANSQGLRDWYARAPRNSTVVEIGSYKGESAKIALESGKVKKIICVDTWARGEWAAAEKDFDAFAALHPQVVKMKCSSVEAAKTFTTQSVEVAYIDATHTEEALTQDIHAWLPKVKAGGIIGGHDFSSSFEGVIAAVHKTLGRVHMVFMDGSWMVRVPTDNYDLFTYCSGGFAPALKMMLPSWQDICNARNIVVFTDDKELEAKIEPNKRTKVVVLPVNRTDDRDESWWRKVRSQRMMWDRCSAKWFAWLDSDVLVARNFSEAFHRMGNCHLAATRMFRSTMRGPQTANSGVIFYRHSPELLEFFDLWEARAKEHQQLGPTGPAGIWFEQHALSDLAHEAWYGLHKFTCSPLPAELFNSEADDLSEWVRQCEKYQPHLLHFKGGQWKSEQTVRRVLQALHPTKTT